MVSLQDQKSVQGIEGLFPRVRPIRLGDNVVVIYYMFFGFSTRFCPGVLRRAIPQYLTSNFMCFITVYLCC